MHYQEPERDDNWQQHWEQAAQEWHEFMQIMDNWPAQFEHIKRQFQPVIGKIIRGE